MINFKKFLEMIVYIREQVIAAKQSDKKIVGVFGWTGSGKSTTIDGLMGSQLIFDDNGRLVVAPGEKVFAEIGHGDESHTLYPELINDAPGDYAFFDTAGVMDERKLGKETESCVAGCSLPILLQDSAIHTLCVVISKNFLEREGKASFKELFESLGNFVDFNNDLVRRKIVFVFTKTIDTASIKKIKKLEKLISSLPLESRPEWIETINEFFSESEQDIRTSLATRKTTLNLENLIDERDRYGNVFMFHGGGKSKDVIENFWGRLMGCNLLHADRRPTANNIANFSLGFRAAYVRYEDKLYYINQFEGTCLLLTRSPQIITKFDKEMRFSLLPIGGLRNLKAEELTKITALTGHSHLQNIMQPLPKAAFPLFEPKTIESGFSNLRARVDAIEVGSELAQHAEIFQFKTALRNIIQAFNLLTAQAIHLPNLADLCGKNLQTAVLNLLAFYIKNDTRNFPQSLINFVACMAELSPLIKQKCSEVEELCGLLDLLVTELNKLMALPLLTAELSEDDQITAIETAVARINTISREHLDAFNLILGKLGAETDELYWHQLLRGCVSLSRSSQFQLSAGRDANLQATLNTLTQFTHGVSDDALICMLADNLLTVKANYNQALSSPLTITTFPLANNIPLIHRAFHAIFKLIQHETADTDPYGILLTEIKENIIELKQKVADFATNPATILNQLLTDYYQCLQDIQTTQTNYIATYQRTCAQNVNLMAGPQAYITGFQGGNVNTTLNVAGGGTLNPYLVGRIDNALLAGEALGLSEFSLGDPTVNHGVAGLVLQGRNFIILIGENTGNIRDGAGGRINAKELFADTNAIFERRVNLKVKVSGQNTFHDVYSTRIFKSYEYFLVKAAFWSSWHQQEGDYYGTTPSSPGNFLIDFGGYNVRRRPPFEVRYCENSTDGGYGHYMYDRNNNYDQQTQAIEAEINQAKVDYVDIQLSRSANRSPRWAFQPITLSSLDSEVTLTNQQVITDTRTAIDNWFINHRRIIANSLATHTATLNLPTTDPVHLSAQAELDKRKIALINLDIQIALIKLFAKMLGKTSNAAFFNTLVTADNISTEVANIINLTATDLAPTLTSTLNATHITAQDISNLPEDYLTHYLHPRTLLTLLESKLELYATWRNIRSKQTEFTLCKPPIGISLLDFINKLPAATKKIEIQNRDFSSTTDQACLVIMIRNHARHLRHLRLHNIGLKNIGNLLQMCTNIHELDLSHNPLSSASFSDLTLFLARNPELKKLDISVSQNNAKNVLDNNCALNLLAALYLNKNLTTLVFDNFIFEAPIIKYAINHLMLFKSSFTVNINAMSENDYFIILDTTLNEFLETHAHPVAELDKRAELFKNGHADDVSLLRSKIQALKTKINAANMPYSFGANSFFSFPQAANSSNPSAIGSAKSERTNISQTNTTILGLIKMAVKINKNNEGVSLIFQKLEQAKEFVSELLKIGFDHPTIPDQAKDITSSNQSKIEYIVTLTSDEYNAVMDEGAFENLVLEYTTNQSASGAAMLPTPDM